ncbi:hypothetical protein QQF64_006439 [Cirrhinus molitorella]|uniref:Secreted protein n=1 Tax=Cirrhinus molitorella TaxID=172907 RepID=A0ABR3MFG8_9TELE
MSFRAVHLTRVFVSSIGRTQTMHRSSSGFKQFLHCFAVDGCIGIGIQPASLSHGCQANIHHLPVCYRRG